MNRGLRAACAAAALGLGLACLPALRPGVTPGEAAGLALATGHGLDWRPTAAMEGEGDFLLPKRPLPASRFLDSLNFKSPDPARGLLRAVLISDPLSPAHAFILHAWLRLAGAAPVALRCLSLLAWLACFPLLWDLGRRLRGPSSAAWACGLFALQPLLFAQAAKSAALALLWLGGLGLAWISLRLKQSRDPSLGLAWAALAGLGLHLHPLFFAVMLACGLPLWRGSGFKNAWPALGALLVYLPWASLLPGALSWWRAADEYRLTELGFVLPWRAALLGAGVALLALAPEGGRPWWRPALALGVGLALAPALWSQLGAPGPARAAGALKGRLQPGDVLLVQGHPSGILALAAGLPPETPVLGWSGQGMRPPDLAGMLKGAPRVLVATLHPRPELGRVTLRLRKEAFLRDSFLAGGVLIEVFSPSAGQRF